MCVPVWIQKEQWLLKVGLEPLDYAHTGKAQKTKKAFHDKKTRVLFEATLLDVASGIFFCSNYNMWYWLFQAV